MLLDDGEFPQRVSYPMIGSRPGDHRDRPAIAAWAACPSSTSPIYGHAVGRSCFPWMTVGRFAPMTTRTTPAVDPTSAGDTSIDDLINCAADLKGELVAFAQGPRFARRLDALLSDAADRRGHLDESAVVLTIDHFALQYRFPDGRAVVERFVTQRHPPLSDDEQAMVLGWRDVVEGCFEVVGAMATPWSCTTCSTTSCTASTPIWARGVVPAAQGDVRHLPDRAGPPGNRRLAGQRARRSLPKIRSA